MMRRTRKDAARRSFEDRRNDRRKHGLGRVEEYGDASHWTGTGAGAGDGEIEADEPQYEPITWRGRYYHSKLGFRGVEECQPGSPAATLVALCRELPTDPIQSLGSEQLLIACIAESVYMYETNNLRQLCLL